MAVASREEVEAKLIEQALNDEQFARALRSDPRAAVESEMKKLGISQGLGPNVRIQVLEETADTLYLVIPSRAQLSDSDLDRVAGAGDFKMF